MSTIEPELQDTLAGYETYLAHSGLSQATVKGYLGDIKQFASWLAREGTPSPLAGTTEEIRRYCLQLVIARAHPPATVNRRLQAIRKFFRYAVQEGLVDEDPSEGVKLLPQPRSEGARGLDRSEIERLLDAVRGGGSRFTRRDYAILQVMLQTGIRVGELTRLKLGDVTLSDDRGALKIRGRRAFQAREIPLNSSARKALKAYLDERLGGTSQHLFLSRQGEPLSARSVQRLVNTYAEAAGLENVTTYSLRQTYGQQLLRDTGDLFLVARLMGHKRLETAIKYIVPGQDDLREVAEKSSLNVY
ncbi:MAG: tyrosine-type recombinase/integrase [Anaerolineae bacterium]|nr:tyrosine-type recombinase/integrase [Anaerolineae bacterium]NIN98031.1 tyrosine-type recombinase/integrase [Anaerolineae bacterium]NIQ80980.1 tyrosine-type recombinase/integrase [Anaerolineae bacterium]